MAKKIKNIVVIGATSTIAVETARLYAKCGSRFFLVGRDKGKLKNILIVDDSSTSRMIIKRCFEISGIDDSEYYYAGNGLEALDVVKNQEIDLIITDINMPKMDGSNLIKKLKSEESLKDIPIVVTSSMSGSGR